MWPRPNIRPYVGSRGQERALFLALGLVTQGQNLNPKLPYCMKFALNSHSQVTSGSQGYMHGYSELDVTVASRCHLEDVVCEKQSFLFCRSHDFFP